MWGCILQISGVSGVKDLQSHDSWLTNRLTASSVRTKSEWNQSQCAAQIWPQLRSSNDMLEQGGDDEMSDILCRSNPVHRQTGLCCQGWFSHTAGIQRGCIPLFRRTHYMILGNPFPHFGKSIPLFLEIHSLVSGNPLPRFRKLISSFWKIHTSILRNSFPDFRWPILWFWEIPYLFSGNLFPCFRKLIPSFQEIHFLMFRNPSPILRNPFPHFRKSIPPLGNIFSDFTGNP